MKRAILVLAGVLIASSAWAGTAYFGGFTGETGTIQYPTWVGAPSSPPNEFMVHDSNNGAVANNDGTWTVKSKWGRRNAGLWATIPTDWSKATRDNAFSVPDIASPVAGQVAYTATMTAKLNTLAVAKAVPFDTAGNPYIGFRMEPNGLAIRASVAGAAPSGFDNMKAGVALELQTDGLWKFRDEQGNAQNVNWFASPYTLRPSSTVEHVVKFVITKMYVAMPAASDPLYEQLTGSTYGYAPTDPIAVVTIRTFVDGVDLGLYKWRAPTTDYTTVFDGAAFFVGGEKLILLKSVSNGTSSDVSGYTGFVQHPSQYTDAPLTAAAYNDTFNIITRGFPTQWIDPVITGTNVPDMNVSLDNDSDNLSNYSEVTIGLNPLVSNVNVDTDGDGVKDIEEVQLGLNPLVVDSNGDGYSDKVAASLFPSNPLAVISASQLPVAGLAGLALLGLGLAAAGVRRIRK